MACEIVKPAKGVLFSLVRNSTVKQVRKLSGSCLFPCGKKKMEGLEITEMKVVPCVDSRFIQPSRVVFKQNGQERKWDYLTVHDSVCALLFNTTRQSFILVKQFRPAVYMHVNRNLHKKALNDGSAVTMTADDSSLPITAPFNEGVTYELCAGIIDKNMSLAGLMKQEILEECGYDVPEENLQEIASFRGGVGSTGSLQTFFFAKVTDEMCVSQGGGNLSEGEKIEVFYLPLENSKEFVFDATKHKPAGLMFAFMWYFNKFNI